MSSSMKPMQKTLINRYKKMIFLLVRYRQWPGDLAILKLL